MASAAGAAIVGCAAVFDLAAQAVLCGDCIGCAIKCPNGVQVKDRLMRAQELFA